QEAREETLIRQAEDGADVGGGNAASAEGDDLIEDRQRVAHAALAATGEDLQRLILRVDFFGFADLTKTPNQLVDGDFSQREFLYAREDRRRHLLHLGGGEHEDDVRRRLLDQLQQRVPRRSGEHVRLVDDEGAVSIARRLALGQVAELA